MPTDPTTQNFLAMPAKGHATAPSFDVNDPFAFHGYFLELEMLFKRCGITTDSDKKEWAVRYLTYTTAELWRSIPEFKDAAKTFEEFKKALRNLYPGADESHKYSITDLDRVVQDRLRVGMTNAYDLAAYYRDFYTISEYLIGQQVLSTLEQDRKFRAGFPATLWVHVENHLNLKEPDHARGKPWTFQKIYEAAQWVLDGPTPSTTYQTFSTPHPSQVPTIPAGHGVGPLATVHHPTPKTEELLPVIERLIHSVEQLAAGDRRPRTPFRGQLSERDAPTCLYCGRPNCRIRNCEMAAEDIAKGYCYRSPEGRIVAFDGRYLQRAEEQTIRDAIIEYARKNGLTQKGPSATIPSNAPSTGTMLYEVFEPAQQAEEVYNVNLGERIQELSDGVGELREIFAQGANGGRKQFEGVIIERKGPRSTARPTNLPNNRPRSPGQQGDRRVHFEDRRTPPSQFRPPTPKEGVPKSAEPSPVVPSSAPGTQADTSKIHPYAQAKDATYAPPATRNFGTPPKFQARSGAYTTITPIVQKELADTIFKRTMEATSLPLTIQEILSISPDLRSRYREVLAPKRVPNEPPVATNLTEDGETGKEYVDTTVLLDCHGNELDPNATVVPDVHPSFYHSAERDDVLLAAKESIALRTIPLTIDKSEDVDCILDPGSQVICMSAALCHKLGLMYDPMVTLSMQSANGGLDRSLGLIRNVPCSIGPITLYLQIHVIERASYDVLLGRPFDVITESSIRNYSDERQTITLVCPNTRQHVTIPTKPRSRPVPVEGKGFRRGLLQRSAN